MTRASREIGLPRPQSKNVSNIDILCRMYTREAVGVLASVMRNPKTTPGTRVSAAIAILDRGWGKPLQQVSSQVQGELQVTIIKALEGQTIEHEEIGHDSPSGERG